MNDILYHYCPTQSFTSIVNSESIWLSSLTLSNDRLEGRLVTDVLKDLAGIEGIDETALTEVLRTVSIIEEIHDGLAFCLSTKDDLLSQWRGYANNGTGVAIGFSVPYLNYLVNTCRSNGSHPNLALEKIAYTTDEQIEQVKPIYQQLRKHIVVPGPLSYSYLSTQISPIEGPLTVTGLSRATPAQMKAAARLMDALSVVQKLYVLKGRAFSEESEWRLLSTFVKVAPNAFLYRERENYVVPYSVLDLRLNQDLTQGHPIAKVILGPKHKTPINVIKLLLKNKGFGDVEVIPSTASYQ